MKRTTVKIPDELDALLRHEAQRRGITISQITREALEAHLAGEGAAGRATRRRVFHGVGMFHSGKPGIAHRAKESIREEWEDDLMKRKMGRER
jgi:hypothetical protein